MVLFDAKKEEKVCKKKGRLKAALAAFGVFLLVEGCAVTKPAEKCLCNQVSSSRSIGEIKTDLETAIKMRDFEKIKALSQEWECNLENLEEKLLNLEKKVFALNDKINNVWENIGNIKWDLENAVFIENDWKEVVCRNVVEKLENTKEFTEKLLSINPNAFPNCKRGDKTKCPGYYLQKFLEENCKDLSKSDGMMNARKE